MGLGVGRSATGAPQGFPVHIDIRRTVINNQNPFVPGEALVRDGELEN